MSKTHCIRASPSRPSRPLRGRDHRDSRQRTTNLCSPERNLSSFCEFPAHHTTALPHLEPTTPAPSFPTLRATRVGYYPGSGLAVAAAAATTTHRRLRPSRASPARLRYPAATALCTGRAASSLRSGTSRAKRYVVGDVHRSTPCRVRRDRAVTTFRHGPCLAAHDVPLRVW